MLHNPPLTSTFVLRILEDAMNLIFGSPMWYIVGFFIVFFVLAVLKRTFTLFR